MSEDDNVMLRFEVLHNERYAFDAIVGLGGLAEFGIHGGRRHVWLIDGLEIRSRWVAYASFRTGLPQAKFWKWQPGIVFSFSKQIKDIVSIDPKIDSGSLGMRLSWQGSWFEAHAGMLMWHMKAADDMNPRTFWPRPVAGFSLTTKRFPRASLGADFLWVPTIDLSTNLSELDWVFSWGGGYKVTDWLTIEANAQHRGDIKNTLVSISAKLVL